MFGTRILMDALRTQPWTIQETTRMLSAIKKNRLIFRQDSRPSSVLWPTVAEEVPGRTPNSCFRRFRVLLRHPEMQHYLNAIQSEDKEIVKALNYDTMERIAGKAGSPMLSKKTWSLKEDDRLIDAVTHIETTRPNMSGLWLNVAEHFHKQRSAADPVRTPEQCRRRFVLLNQKKQH